MSVGAPTRGMPVKMCARCLERKPWSEFYAKTRWADGTIRQPHSYCKACMNSYRAGWEREKRRSDRKWAQAHDRRRHATVRADAERWAARLVYESERRSGRLPRARARATRPPTVDAAPFRAWLLTLARADRANLPASAEVIRRVVNGRQDRVSIDTVDRCCLHLDVDLNDIYPLEDA